MKLNAHWAWQGESFPYESPRGWQTEALPIALSACAEGVRPVVQAVMGAGKADWVAELIWCCIPDKGETIVVSAPFRFLVRQLAATIAGRVGSAFVGQYHSDAKEPHRRVVVTSHDSMENLAKDLKSLGRKCALWISDECHRTENETIRAAVEAMDPGIRIGLTATPYLANKRSSLDLWDSQIYSYSAERALEDGVIVPWRLVEWTGADLNFEIACLHMARDADGPGVVNAESIDDAKYFASLAHEFGLKVATVHSGNSDDQNDQTIEDLRLGRIKFVVHVSMLQEGVNLPWLRWLLLRRATQSRVRFAQEVGRVLRAHPGKEFATIYDPNELFSIFKLSYDACLAGGTIDGEDKAVDPGELVEATAQLVFDAILGAPEGATEQERIIRGLRPAEAYLRALAIALRSTGIVDGKVASSSMRRDPPSTKQVQYAGTLRKVLTVTVGLPERHRNVLLYACNQAYAMNRGAVSDLISIMVGLRKAKSWPQLAEQMTTHLI